MIEFIPQPSKKTKLAQLFGCVRVVWNDSLAYCQQKYKLGEKKPTNGELEKLFITQAKKTDERQWLSEVSNIPLQQSLNDLNPAYQNFSSHAREKERVNQLRRPNLKSVSPDKLLDSAKVDLRYINIRYMPQK